MLDRISLYVFLVVLIFISGISSLGFAGTVGNPANIDAPGGAGVFSMRQDKNFAIKTGFDAEFLFDRNINADASTKVEFTSGEWYMTKLSYVMFNRVEPYVKLGMVHMKAKWTEAGSEIKLESDTGFAWGLGAKVLLCEFKRPKIKILTDGFYRTADLDADKGYRDGSKVSLNVDQSRFTVREWQIALLASTEIDVGGSGREEVLGVSTMIPYAGVKYSDINGRLRLLREQGDFNNPGKIKSDQIFGLFAGCDFVGPNSVSLNVESRFIDELALTAGLAILF